MSCSDIRGGFPHMNLSLIKQNLQILTTFNKDEKPIIRDGIKLIKENRWIFQAARRYFEGAFNPDFIANLFEQTFEYIEDRRKYSFLSATNELEDSISKSLIGLKKLIATYHYKPSFSNRLEEIYLICQDRLENNSKRHFFKKDHESARKGLKRRLSESNLERGTVQRKKRSYRVSQFLESLRNLRQANLDKESLLKELKKEIQVEGKKPRVRKNVLIPHAERRKVMLVRRNTLPVMEKLIVDLRKNVQEKMKMLNFQQESDFEQDWE